MTVPTGQLCTSACTVTGRICNCKCCITAVNNNLTWQINDNFDLAKTHNKTIKSTHTPTEK